MYNLFVLYIWGRVFWWGYYRDQEYEASDEKEQGAQEADEVFGPDAGGQEEQGGDDEEDPAPDLAFFFKLGHGDWLVK